LILNRKRISKVDSISNILQYLIKMISGLEKNGGEDRRSLSNVRLTINAGRKYRRVGLVLHFFFFVVGRSVCGGEP